MKRLTNGIKVWIAGSTLVGFLTGWSVLAHSGGIVADSTTPAPASQMTVSTQTTTQIPSLDTSTTATSAGTVSSDNQSQSLQQLSAPAVVARNAPRLRTSGS
jgi:cytoskeletal protein RodZ